MHRLILLGLNHTTAPLEVREKLAFDGPQRAEALSQFRSRFPDCEAVLVSTCNRVELYVARGEHTHPRAEEMADFLAGFHSLPVENVRPHLYEKAGTGLVDHLFTVASSLDSMVLGETQILGQVREAYESAAKVSATGTLLNPLFQRALAVGKQVMHETPLAEGRLSVASVAVDFARQIFENFQDKTVLCIGAGKMATLALKHFRELSPGRLLICNRDAGKAIALAKEFAGEVADFEKLDDHLATVDIVITSTGAPTPIITARRFAIAHRRRRYRPIFLIDIALPRDIEPAVGELENAYLYNMDDLQQVVQQNQAGRSAAVESARAIIDSAVQEYIESYRARAMGPVIDKLYKRYHALAAAELERTLNKLPNISETERAHMQELTRRVVNKLLHDPVQAIRKAGEQHGEQSPYLHVMEQLFKLSDQE